MTRRPWRAAAMIGCAAVLLALISPASAGANPTYPTWAQVQAARANAAAKKAETQQLTAILSGFEAKSAALGQVAVLKDEAYHQAQAALTAATTRSTQLSAKADTATATAAASRKRADGVLSLLSRQGGGDLTVALFGATSSGVDSLLYRIGALDQLSGASESLVQQAVYDQNQASSLRDDAATAQKELARRAAASKTALASAQNAQTAADAQVASTKTESDTAYAQLASLTDQSAAELQGYLAGVAWEKAQEAKKTAPVAKPLNPNPPAPVAGAVNTAIAFAKAQLGEPYVIDGAGPNVWDCSGLTMMAYSAAGVNIGGHGATLQYNYLAGQGRLVTIQQLQPGDLLFYSSGGSTRASKYHVTLYIGGGQMIEAAYPGTNVRIAAIRYGELVPYAARPTG